MCVAQRHLKQTATEKATAAINTKAVCRHKDDVMVWALTFRQTDDTCRRVTEHDSRNVVVVELSFSLIVEDPMRQLSSGCYGNWNNKHSGLYKHTLYKQS